ncbi:MAG: single-stranded-DNA-specific exonuclease RecJ [Lachnospiraceae bacterium]|nr:single-stranded-DNA-specific exonuclease RecJ [Lachnospiraceae bacterium]
MKKYVLLKKGLDFKRLGDELNVDPMIIRLMRNKGITDIDGMRKYLYGNPEDLHSPWLLNDMRKAVDILIEKIVDKKKIRIIGDYDIDGVQSTYILYDAIKNLGGDVDFAIPDRIADGYGINEKLVEKAHLSGADTILTCDNGISAFAQIEQAKSLGMTVIVTDHHDIPLDEDKGAQRIVSADAVVNPKIHGSAAYPYEEICGAVVAWKLMIALYEKMGNKEDILNKYLENAAFATVGDVMDLADENRIIVKYGLEAMKHTKNPGLAALMEQKNVTPDNLKAYHIGFVLGPCINASGRLDTAEHALKLFLEKDEDKAKKIAAWLTDLNDKRKDMTADGEEEAFNEVESTDLMNDKVLVVYMPNLHESLAGIVAGRVRERYYKPTFVITKTESGELKGSGRSIENYSMFNELQKADDLLLKYGGHPMAAGLSIEEKNLISFRKRLNDNCSLTEDDFNEKVKIDAILPFSYITTDFIDALQILEPFGKANSKPLFAEQNVNITNTRVFGANQNVLRCTLKDAHGGIYNGVYFGDATEMEERIRKQDSFSVVYSPKKDEYRGENEIQIVLEDIF